MPALNSDLILHTLRRLPSMAADLVLPPACPGCSAATGRPGALCPACWSVIRFIEPPLCAIYGTPFAHDFGEGSLSPEAMADPPPFRRARAAAIFGDVARRLVHQVKYHDRPDLARVMTVAMARAGRELIAGCDLIVPVPLHRFRLWQRRFNQSAMLGKHLSALTGLPHDPFALQRVRPTLRQVGLSAAQRDANVRGAFRVPDRMRSAILGRSVLLVDDVYTSGSTAKAATRALLRGGAAAVDVLTFARVSA